MSNKFFVLNIIMAVLDFVICLAAVATFAWSGYHFNHWWIDLFALLPLALFSSHGLVVDADIHEAEGGEDGA